MENQKEETRQSHRNFISQVLAAFDRPIPDPTISGAKKPVKTVPQMTSYEYLEYLRDHPEER